MKSSLQDEIRLHARELSGRGVDCVLERFRLPASPRPTPPAGLFAGSAAAFALAADMGAVSVLLAAAGLILLWLDARGFSPLDWLGRKESRSVLVARGTPSDGERKALFFCVPLVCRLTKDGVFSGEESIRRSLHAAGLLLCAGLLVASTGLLLRLWDLPPGSAAASGIVLIAVSVLEAFPRSRPETLRNRAAGWMGFLSRPAEDGRRPYLLLYSGDPEEVKYFLARHRGELARGTGVFLEFSPAASGPAAVSVREGPIFPLPVDAALLERVASAARDCGIPSRRETILRHKSPGMFAMARGFRAVTLFRWEARPGEGTPYTEEEAKEWASGVFRHAVSRRRGKRFPPPRDASRDNASPGHLTGASSGV